MKNILITVLLSLCSIGSVYAHGGRGGGHYGGGHYGGGYGYRWVAPAVIGGAIGYGISRYYYAPAPVYAPVQPYYPVPQQYTQPQYYTVFDPECNCYRTLQGAPQQ